MNPIPPELATGFRDALDFYQSSWSPAEHGRLVSIGQKSFTIGDVCGLVSEHTDKLPSDILIRLLDCMDIRYGQLKQELSERPTYQTAARCLLQLISDREAEWRRPRS